MIKGNIMSDYFSKHYHQPPYNELYSYDHCFLCGAKFDGRVGDDEVHYLCSACRDKPIESLEFPFCCCCGKKNGRVKPTCETCDAEVEDLLQSPDTENSPDLKQRILLDTLYFFAILYVREKVDVTKLNENKNMLPKMLDREVKMQQRWSAAWRQDCEKHCCLGWVLFRGETKR